MVQGKLDGVRDGEPELRKLPIIEHSVPLILALYTLLLLPPLSFFLSIEKLPLSSSFNSRVTQIDNFAVVHDSLNLRPRLTSSLLLRLLRFGVHCRNIGSNLAAESRLLCRTIP